MNSTLLSFAISCFALGIQFQAFAAQLPTANPVLVGILALCTISLYFFLVNERPIP